METIGKKMKQKEVDFIVKLQEQAIMLVLSPQSRILYTPNTPPPSFFSNL